MGGLGGSITPPPNVHVGRSVNVNVCGLMVIVGSQCFHGASHLAGLFGWVLWLGGGGSGGGCGGAGV